MVLILLGVLNFVIGAALFGCVLGWVLGLIRLRRGQPLLQPEPRFRSLIGFAEVIMAVGLWLVLTIAGLTAAQGMGWIGTGPDGAAAALALDADFAAHVTIEGIAKLVAIALLLVWLSFLDPQALRRLGVLPRFRDFKIGVVGAAMLIPPLLMIQQLLNLITPYEHPVKDLIEARPTPLMGVLLAINTVLIAPLAEEFFFRGLLQGWFQRVARRRGTKSPVGERVETEPEPLGSPETAGEEGEMVSEQQSASAASPNPYAPSAQATADSSELTSRLPSDMVPAGEVRHWPWWPVILTSVLFALIHWGQGAAPVSLFFFALGLSYLTRQTGSLWPAITVHFFLNACATAAMFLSAGAPTDPPPLGP